LTVNKFVPFDPCPPPPFQSVPPDSVFYGVPLSHNDVSPFLHPDTKNKEKTPLFNPSLKLAALTNSVSCTSDVASAASSCHQRQMRPRKRKAHRDSFFLNDVPSVVSFSHSHGRLRSLNFRTGSSTPQSVSTQSNWKSRRRQSWKHLKKADLATDYVSTQPWKPANKVQVASNVTPTKYLENSRF
jgi:hypothetical protein